MTAATRTIVTSAIRADLTISPGVKEKMLRYLTNPHEEPEMRLFSERQAALVLGVSVPTIARMKRDGELKTRKINIQSHKSTSLLNTGPSRQTRFAPSLVIIEQPIELVISESASDRRVLDLPANLATIEANAFEGTSAETVILPEGCTFIGARAFAGCRDLEDVYIPTTLTSIAADAFANSPNVRFIIGNNPTAESYAKKHGIEVIGE